MGDLAGRFDRFPLLLKFLDVQTALSVQVHPSQPQAAYLPAGETAKTEAWFVLRTGENSCVYAGLKPGATATTLRQASAVVELPDQLASFAPEPGEFSSQREPSMRSPTSSCSKCSKTAM